jgi:(p)ppGpp synthase/HD superfamily hydrolase
MYMDSDIYIDIVDNVENMTWIKSWQEYKIDIVNINNIPWKELLINLVNEWIDQKIISDLENDFRYKENIEIFKSYIEIFFVDENVKKDIYKALSIAIEAHKGDFQKAPLNFIPYSNHPIQVARFCLNYFWNDSKLIIWALLHDVVEDTKVTDKDLSEDFWSDIIKIIDWVTQLDWEEREIYLDRVKKSWEKVLIIKVLDRLHNLYRMFSRWKIKEEKLEKYIVETEKYYLPVLQGNDIFKGLKTDFEFVLGELKKHLEFLKSN